MHLFIHGSVGVLAAGVFAHDADPEPDPIKWAAAVAVSWVAHYLGDMIPHWDPCIASPTAKWDSPEVKEFLSVSAPDIASCFMLGILLPSLVPALPFWLTFACVGVSVLPDAVDGIAKLTNWRVLQYHRKLHDYFHYDHGKYPVGWWWSVLLHLGLFFAIGVATYFALHVNGRFSGH